MRAGPHVKSIVAGLRNDGLEDLVDSLKTTRRNVESWWGVPKLYWFTDHGVAHSYQVAAIADRLAHVRELPPAVALTAQELYLLEMAAWLHDIGMQAVSAPGAESDEYPTDPNVVRENHARQSFRLISSHEFDIGLPINLDSTTQFIAWLVLAHGTDTYLEAVEALRQSPRLNEQEVRGPLLAAFLLMADELHLHSKRVKHHGAIEVYGAVSNAHWLKHECIDDVQIHEVDSGDGDRIRIELKIKSFRGMTAQQWTSVRQWVCDKLLKQISLVEPEITVGLKNHFRFQRDIGVQSSALSGPANPRVTDEVLAIMDADNAREVLINHVNCRTTASDAITSGTSVVLIGEDVGIMEDGREDIFSYICAAQRLTKRLVLTVPREPGLGSNRTAADVLAVWLSDAGVPEALDEDEHESERRSRLLRNLVERLGSEGEPALLAISSIDALDDLERDWLLGTAVLALQDRATFFFSAGRALNGSALWEQIIVGPTPHPALEKHLSRYMSAAEAARAVAAGVTYSTVRRYGLQEVSSRA